MNKPKRALSIRQPYAEMILRGTKKVENRSTPTNFRERVYIYASKTKPEEVFEEMEAHPEKYPVGVLVGTVEITGCTKKQEKKYQWHLAKPERLPKLLKPENRPQPRWFHPFKEENYSVPEFIRAIRHLPSDKPVVNSKVWYETQQQHWLGWLKEYDGPGAYGRIPGQGRDARYAYNRIVCHKMLLWIIEAAGVSSNLVEAARRASEKVDSLQSKSAAIRKLVPWSVLAEALWSNSEKE